MITFHCLIPASDTEFDITLSGDRQLWEIAEILKVVTEKAIISGVSTDKKEDESK